METTERKKGAVSNTFADGSGVWYAEVEADRGNGSHDVFGCPLRTVYNRAAKAIHTEIQSRQGQAAPPVKVAYLGLRRRPDGSFYALFKEKEQP